ncbi:MAG: hypothetical protein ACFCUI_07945 [Bernardetiaceae bacterium]
MDCQKLQSLLAQAKFESLFRELNALPLKDDPDLQATRDTLAANYKRYQRDRPQMDTRDYERVMSLLIKDLTQLIRDLCAEGKPPERSQKPKTFPDRVQPWLGLFLSVIGILGFFGIKECKPWSDDDIPPPALYLTVYVHGPDSRQQIILQNTGRLVADFGNDRRTPEIGQNGRTNFGEIPERFRKKKKIELGLEAEGYELVKKDTAYLLDGEPIYLEVKEVTIPEPEEKAKTAPREDPVSLHTLTFTHAPELVKHIVWEGKTYIPTNNVVRLPNVTREEKTLMIIFKDSTEWGKSIHAGLTEIAIFDN